mmetsp:Transcript_38620/g.115949  ORF Transcript_38620/g.115949 Transcript_38620/m.115949 type:complete len:228 (-) Transcript_38620:288-971(-)
MKASVHQTGLELVGRDRLPRNVQRRRDVPRRLADPIGHGLPDEEQCGIVKGEGAPVVLQRTALEASPSDAVLVLVAVAPSAAGMQFVERLPPPGLILEVRQGVVDLVQGRLEPVRVDLETGESPDDRPPPVLEQDADQHADPVHRVVVPQWHADLLGVSSADVRLGLEPLRRRRQLAGLAEQVGVAPADVVGDVDAGAEGEAEGGGVLEEEGQVIRGGVGLGQGCVQ